MLFIAIFISVCLISTSLAFPLGSVCAPINTGNKLLDVSSILGYVDRSIWPSSLKVIHRSMDKTCFKEANLLRFYTEAASEYDIMKFAVDYPNLLECLILARKLAVISTIGQCYSEGVMFEDYLDTANTERVFFSSNFEHLRTTLLKAKGVKPAEVAKIFPCYESCEREVQKHFNVVLKNASTSCRFLPREAVAAGKLCYKFNQDKNTKLAIKDIFQDRQF